MAEATPETTSGRLRLLLVTHDRKLLDVECDEVVLPGRRGYLGILPGHTALLATLKVGEMSYRAGREERHLALGAGFVEVANDVVTVLADFANLPEEIDVAAAERAAVAAAKAMETAAGEEQDAARTELELAQARIAVARRT